MTTPPVQLVPRARRASRALAVAGVASGLLGGGRLARRTQEGLTLAALAFGMPHGAADTELLRSGTSRTAHLALLGGYAATAAGATAAIRRGGTWVERGVLVASALHFGEGELATWPRAARPTTVGTGLRLVGAAAASVLLPAAVTVANRRADADTQGSDGAVAVAGGRVGSARPGLALLRDPRARHPALLATLGLAGAASAGLLALGDREAGLDVALMAALPVLAPPAVAFASYFGGWHSLRHTARVADALVARGELSAPQSLPAGLVDLGRRSLWAAAVGAGGAAVLVAKDPKRASDNAFAVVLGLTVPHMLTVLAQLTRHERRARLAAALTA